MKRHFGFFVALFSVCVALALASCATAPRASAPATIARAVSPARFIVIGDPHVYDTSLGTSGPAFEMSTAGSRVLYAQSAELFHEAIERTIALNPDFVLVPGDLTKDGEPSSHELVLRELSALRAAGIRAYVIPGNHDIADSRAWRFEGNARTPIQSITPKDFLGLYADYGYSDAISRDPNSLTYVAQLAPGLRLIALDSFNYPETPDPLHPDPVSAFGHARLAWIATALDAAARDGIEVVAMMHESVLEHFRGQASAFPDSFARERRQLASLLASRGIRLVFTGHFHIQDIVRYRFSDGASLYDVATGSLAAYPLAYRIVELLVDSSTGLRIARVHSERIDSIPSIPQGLETFAKLSLEARVSALLEGSMGHFGLPVAERKLIADRFAEAFVALSLGDEKPIPGSTGFPPGIRSFLGRVAELLFGGLLGELQRDAPPFDNEAVLELGP